MKENMLAKILNAQASAGKGTNIAVQDFMNIVIQLSLVGFTGTIKVVGSISEVVPDFASAASDSNQWEYVASLDLKTGDTINGDVGITGSTTTSVRLLNVQTLGLKWLNIVITRSAGSVSAVTRLFNNL